METEGQAKEILQVLRSIYQRHLACDFIIELSEPTAMEFRVHKVMLAAFAKKFKKLLEAGKLETDRYQIQAVDSETMSQLVDYIYTGNLEVNAQTVWPILAAASQLEMAQVISICQNFLMSNVDDGQLQRESAKLAIPADNMHVVNEPAIGDILDSKEQLLPVIQDCQLTHCRDVEGEVKPNLVKRKPRKRKRGRWKIENSKKRKEQKITRKYRKKIASESDEEYLCQQVKDEEQQLSRPMSLRSQNRKTYSTRFITNSSSLSTLGSGHQLNMKSCKQNLEPRCNKTRHINGQLDDSYDKQQHSLTPDLSSSLDIPKLTFNDLKCSICHDIFIHYSTKVLHEKCHHRLTLKWLGVLQRRYMPLYVRQYFSIASDSSNLVQDGRKHICEEDSVKSTDGVLGNSELCNNNVHGNDVDHHVSNGDDCTIEQARDCDVLRVGDPGARQNGGCGMSEGGNIDGSQIDKCDVPKDGDSGLSSAGDNGMVESGDYHVSQDNDFNISQATDGEVSNADDCGVSHVGDHTKIQHISQTNDSDTSNKPVYDELSTNDTAINHQVADLYQDCDVHVSTIHFTNMLQSVDGSMKKEHPGVSLGDVEAKSNKLYNNLDLTGVNSDVFGSGLNSVMSSDNCFTMKGPNDIKMEKPEDSINGQELMLKKETSRFRDINNCVITTDKKGWANRQQSAQVKGQNFKVDLNFASTYQCKLCNVKLPYSLCMLHCVQRHGFKRKCKQCGSTFFHPASSAYHRIKVHGVRLRIRNSLTHTCARCGKQFIFADVLKQHNLRFHGRSADDIITPVIARPLVCRHCCCAFKYHKALLMHLPMHGLSENEIQLEFSSPAEVPLHPRINNHRPGQPKKCPVCARLFRAMTTLRQHMNQVHGLPVTRAYIMHMKNMDVKKIQCQEDGCTFSTVMIYELERHMRISHPSASYECQFCRYKTSIKKRMAKHIRLNHMTGKTCEMCGRQFHKHYHLKHHYYKAHGIVDPSLKLHKCPQQGCDYSSLTLYSLDIHMRKHSTEKPYKCTECGRLLKTEKNLEKHMNKIHRGIRPYICDQCGASYGEESELKTHMARHDDAKKYHCMYCDYTTQEKGNYQSHLWARHKVKLHQKQTVFECQKCDYTTDRKTRYTQHMASHNNIRNFKCPHCEKAFIAKNTMTSHIKWTHMDKCMACDYCNHKTSTLNMLREHVRMMHTHRDVKPYQCAYCDYRCRTSGNCRKHCMNKHKGQPIKWLKVCDKYPNNDRPILSMENLPKENGILRKDSRSKRIFSYEPEADMPSADVKQKPSDVQLLQQQVPSVTERLTGLTPVMITGAEIPAQIPTVLTPVLHDSQVQIVQQQHKPAQYQPEQLPPEQQHQQQQDSIQQQYISSVIINPSSLSSVQQEHLLVMMQQHGLKN